MLGSYENRGNRGMPSNLSEFLLLCTKMIETGDAYMLEQENENIYWFSSHYNENASPFET